MGKRILASALAMFFIIGFLPACICTPGVKAPAEIVVNKLEVTPNEVGAGETVTVKADISNVGGLSENYTAILNIDGKERDRQTIYINPSENKTVAFAVKELNIGQHEITIGEIGIKTMLTVTTEKIITLQHDNNVCSYTWMMNDPWGQWIRFDAPTIPFEIRKISIKGSRSPYPLSGNNTYTLKIWDGNFKKQLFTYDYPYTNFSPQGGLVDHDINPPVIVTGTFIIELISHSEWNDHSSTSKDTRIYLCTDSTVTSRDNIGISYFGGNQEDTYQRQIQMEPRFSHATWIIRAEGVRKVAGSVTTAKTPPATLPPPTTEKTTTFNAVKYTHPTYNFSIKYPNGWTPMSTTIKGGEFYAKGPGNDSVYIAVRPATNFREVAINCMYDLIAAEGYQIVPSIDNETTVTLADGTKADVILLSVFGRAKAAITGVLKDGNAIMIFGAMDPKNLELYKEIGSTLVLQTATPNVSTAQSGDNKTTQVVPIEGNQLTQLQGIPITLSYYRGEDLQRQMAVWHPYYRVQQMGSMPGGTRPDERCPVTIIPGAAMPIDGIQPININDEKELLKQPGWGLGTTFSPPKTPFTITNVNMAAVAHWTDGYFGDYYKKYALINILDNNAKVIWSKYLPWSDYRNIDSANRYPKAAWRNIAVDNVTVDGNFTVDILSWSDLYNHTGPQCRYFAVANAAIGDGNSFISDNGKRSMTCIRNLNLLISVDGIY